MRAPSQMHAPEYCVSTILVTPPTSHNPLVLSTVKTAVWNTRQNLGTHSTGTSVERPFQRTTPRPEIRRAGGDVTNPTTRPPGSPAYSPSVYSVQVRRMCDVRPVKIYWALGRIRELELLSTVWEIPQSGAAHERRLPGTWAVNGGTMGHAAHATRSSSMESRDRTVVSA